MQIQILMDKIVRFDKAIENKDYSNLKINPVEYDFCPYKKECPRRAECRKKHIELEKQKKKRGKKTKKVDVEKTAKCVVCGVPIRPNFKKCYKHAFESVQKES